MKYTPQIYAEAFAAVIEEGKVSPDRALNGLLQTLKRRGDIKRGGAVAQEIRKLLVHAKGGRLVRIETARTIPESLMRQIRDVFGASDDVSLAERPELIAGMRVVVDDELELDGSLKRKLNSMFSV